MRGNAQMEQAMRIKTTSVELPKYLTPEEAAAYLRLSPRTLEKHRGEGSGPRYRKLGKVVRYTVPDLDDWAGLHKYYMRDPTLAPRGPIGSRRKR